MRRWTGLRPSRASGRAREWMTEYAYSRYESSTSVVSGLSRMRAPAVSNAARSTSARVVLRRAISCLRSRVDAVLVQTARRFDEPVPPRFDPLTHQQVENLFGACHVGHGDAPHGAYGRVHGGVPEFLGIHLAETLEPRNRFVHRL